MSKRQVEVFTAGCPVCEPVVQLVMELACPDCEVTLHDLRGTEGAALTGRCEPKAAEKARLYGVKRVPAVVVNGQLASCCPTAGASREELAAAGLGQPS